HREPRCDLRRPLGRPHAVGNGISSFREVCRLSDNDHAQPKRRRTFMSLTAMTWCLLAISLSAASVSRPVWALSVYMLTFFAAPSLWWWGDELPELRYSLISGFILLVSVLLHGTHSPVGYDRTRLASK